MGYYRHVAKEGDRWDLLAYEYLGDTCYATLLMNENPHLPLVETIESGAFVFIPETVDSIDATPVDEEILPPWKR